MKQKLLTLFVLIVTAMTAFADDATGSGVATKDHTGAALAENQYVSYSYKFTEDNGNVTMTVTSTNPAAIQDWSSGGLNGETFDGKRTWTGLTTGYVLKIKLWWAIEGGRAVSDEITYTVKGTEAAPDPEKPDSKFNITTSGNVAKVVGPVTAAEVEQINNVDVMNIDLTGVKSIENGVTIQPLRKNAIIVISGTYKEETINENKVCTTTADSKFDAIKDMNNVVVLAADGYYHPLKRLEFVDIPGEPFWTGGLRDLNDFISTGSTGCKVTRTIKKGTHASICVPFAITPTSIPEGLYVWEATNYDTKNNIINFSKAVEVPGNFPCILRNTTDQDIELNWTWTGDINFGNYVGKDAEKKKVGDTDVYFCGNWKEALLTDGKQWIIKNEGINASIVKADGVKISPFRAYFTGIPEGASAKLNFDDEETTGITNVNAAENNDDTLYNLAGQKVNAAYKGIVIKNGKKYLVK